MANLAKLKDKARALEQKGQWKEALDAYSALMDKAGGEEVDVGVWNRIGDLHLRLNQSDEAVAAYEKAADAYAEMGLHNNAIALCNKVLRIAPERGVVHLKLGRASAAKGFWADARQAFLFYAERMQRTGQTDASLDALKEFVDLFPDDDDTDVRLLLADQMRSRGRGEEAVEQLRLLLGQLPRHGREEEAPKVVELIQSIDPEAETTALDMPDRPASDELPRPAGAEPAGGLDLMDSLDLPATEIEAGEELAELELEGADAGAAEPLAGLERTEEPEEMDFGGGFIEIESTALDAGETAGEEEAGEAADAGEAEAAEDEEAEPLPLLGEDPGAAAAAGEEDWGGFTLDEPEVLESGVEEVGEAGAAAEAGAEHEQEAAGEVETAAEGEPLPFLSLDDQGEAAADAVGTEEERLRAALAERPQDTEALRNLVVHLVEAGREDEAEDFLRGILRELAAAGHNVAAIHAVRQLRELRPDDVLIAQKEVEFAFKTGDRELLVAAYRALAERLIAAGDAPKARAVHQRILEIDPENAAAREAFEALPPPAAEPRAPAPAPPPKSAAADSGDYIDLGALIMDDDDEPSGTRFVVDEEEPSGDEDRDFADMLARFRQKVTENIGAEDSSSHYDLGLAFKEMGLLDEAISHFQVALQGGSRPLATLEVMGECFIEKEQWPVAQRVLERALAVPGSDEADQIGVYYLLGRCSEARGELAEAENHYERVLGLDIRFRDAQERIQTVRQRAG